MTLWHRKTDYQRYRELGVRMYNGRQAYLEHDSLADLRHQHHKTTGTSYLPDQIDEICGFIVAMTDEIRSLKEKIAILEKKCIRQEELVADLT